MRHKIDLHPKANENSRTSLKTIAMELLLM